MGVEEWYMLTSSSYGVKKFSNSKIVTGAEVKYRGQVVGLRAKGKV